MHGGTGRRQRYGVPDDADGVEDDLIEAAKLLMIGDTSDHEIRYSS